MKKLFKLFEIVIATQSDTNRFWDSREVHCLLCVRRRIPASDSNLKRHVQKLISENKS